MPRIKSIYKKLYTTKKRYTILTGGRGSGKTFVVMDFACRLMEQVGQGILYTRYTMTSVENTIMPLFKAYIKSIADINSYRITKTKIINKRTGSFLMFSGIKTSSGDQTANLKSLPGITTWIVEEGEDFNKEDSFTDIDDSIRSKIAQNRIIWIQNPTTAEHFIYKRFFEKTHTIKPVKIAGKHNEGEYFTYQESTHPEVEHIHTTYHLNIDNLNTEKVAQWESIKIKNPKKYAHKYIGAWIDKVEGVIFSSWIEGKFDLSLSYGYGQDYGFNIDPTTLIKIAVDQKNKKMYWHEEYYDNKKIGTDDIFKINSSRILKPNDLIVGDSQEGRLIQDLQKKGLNIHPCVKGPGSVKGGLKAMQDYTHIISHTSKNIKKEFNNYCWNDKKAEIPIDDYNHAIDAGRYIFDRLTNRQGVYKVKKRRRK